MNIKLAEQSRVAQYGIALGVLLYAGWRGLAWFFIPKDFDPPRGRWSIGKERP